MNVVLYDDSARDFLTYSWAIGAQLYAARRKVDLVVAVKTWRDVYDLDLVGHVDTLQIWGHGTIAAPLIGGGAPRLDMLAPFLRDVMNGSTSHVWFRSCNVATGIEGKRWCATLADLVGARVAAHTFVIHALQSGLRVAVPGVLPSWSTSEGLRSDGSLEWSRVGAPRTVTCLATDVPQGIEQ